MLQSKKELIKTYENSKNEPTTYDYAFDYYNLIRLIYADDEYVFGFYKEYGEEKHYFKVKIHYPLTDKGQTYIKLYGQRYNLSDFVITNYPM